MDKTDKDDRGRLLRYVIIDNIFINMEMIRKGFGAALDVPPDSSCAQVFQQAEQTARAALTGIWAPTPTKKP
jgi:endonuclease YncB( thermonuclease family)